MSDYKYSLDIMNYEIKSKFICPEIKYAFKTSIEALEKQIPKEVNTECVNRGIDVSGEYDIDFNMLCPSCNAVVGNSETGELWYEYCPDCGQKFKYTPEREEEQ